MILYVTATEVALVDRVQLRFVSTMPATPRELEIFVDLDTRADDDTQRKQLAAAFLRGMAIHIGARFPTAVAVTVTTPADVASVEASTTPWDVALNLGGYGSHTRSFQSLNAYAEAVVTRTTRALRLIAEAGASTNINRQPPLMLDDGTRVPLDVEAWNVAARVQGVYLLSPCWSVGGLVRYAKDDPKGQHAYTTRVRAALEWDLYPADDPRGNRLAVLYTAGYAIERYNLTNEIGERFAHYPIHELIASGTLRKDKIGIGLSLAAGSQLDHPGRRHHVSASPSLEIQLGSRVDISFSFSITKRALPGPDTDLIDPTDYALLTRLAYAEPLALNGSLNLYIHFDRTNGARNDRMSDL